MKVTIQFNTRKNTYIALDIRGMVLGIYDPKVHGTVEEFRNAMAELAA